MQASSNSQQNNPISGSDTKLFKLNSTGNWDDVGTGKATITRSTSEIESIDIFLTMITQPKEKENETTEGEKIVEEEESFVFEGITSFSIQSGSILVFMSRQKRFALSFKDSDTSFLEFFSSQIKSSQENMVQQAQPQSLIASMCADDNNLIEGIKESFYKYQQQDNQVSLGQIFRAFRRLLNECKQDFIRVMFTDQNIQFLFAVFYHNSSKVSYRDIIKNLSYVNMLQLPPNIEKHAKFNMYLSQFKDIGSLVIEPGLQSLMTLFSFENATVIINYLLQNPSILRNKLNNIQQNIPKTVKLLGELTNLSNVASLETRTKLFSTLISENGGNIYYKLSCCLSQEMVKQQVISNKQQVTIFQKIIEMYVIISAINTFSFENFLGENNLQDVQNFNNTRSEFCELLVFGFIHGNINLKSHILQLLSNIFNPQGTKSRWKIQSQNNQIVSHSIYRLIQRKILSPICKQLFKNKDSYSGQQLMVQWISRLFPYFSIILRRVIIDSGIMKKALIHGNKKTIILLLVLKLLKGLLHIKTSNYTIQYLKRSGVICSLHKAYISNKSKNNIISSLFKSIQQDIKQFQGDNNNSRQLQNIFSNQHSNYYQ